MLENAADDARSGSVINVDVSVKPLAEEDIKEDLMKASNINIADFSMILVCKVNYEHDFDVKTELKDLSLESVFHAEPVQKHALKLALITSKMICKSFYGDLNETEHGDFRQYEATLIAGNQDN